MHWLSDDDIEDDNDDDNAGDDGDDNIDDTVDDNDDDNVDDDENDVVAWPGQGGGWRKRSTKITTSCQLPN